MVKCFSLAKKSCTAGKLICNSAGTNSKPLLESCALRMWHTEIEALARSWTWSQGVDGDELEWLGGNPLLAPEEQSRCRTTRNCEEGETWTRCGATSAAFLVQIWCASASLVLVLCPPKPQMMKHCRYPVGRRSSLGTERLCRAVLKTWNIVTKSTQTSWKNNGCR